MSQVQSANHAVLLTPRKMAKPRGTARLLNKIARLPRRIQRSIGHWRDGTYHWERQAGQGVAWLDEQRRLALEKLPGTSSVKECQLLAWLAAEAPAGGVIVEIGAFLGRSAAWLCEGAQRHHPAMPVYSIDPHGHGSWDGFQRTVAQMGLEQRGLVVLRESSQIIGRHWNKPISLLWIDGCHEYDAVCKDIEYFVPHVLQGGWIIFDDAAGGAFPGCERAIAERMPAFKQITRCAVLRHLQVYRVG